MNRIKVNIIIKDEKAKEIICIPAVRKLIKSVYETLGVRDETVNFVFIDSKEMKKYNKEYRKKDSSTDILTFVYIEGEILADILISLEDVEKNAEFFKIDFCEELVRVIIHGILHSLGFDHEEGVPEYERRKMLELQESLVQNYKLMCSEIFKTR